MDSERDLNMNFNVEKMEMKQYISFGTSAGICNRIKRLFSALRFNVDWEKPLDFYWSQGELTNRAFYDLFKFDLFEFNEIPCKIKMNKEDEYDVAADLSWRLEIKDGEVPTGFTQAYPKDDASKEYIDFEYNRIPANVMQVYMKYFNALMPSDIVQKRIDSIRLPDNCVGVHLRPGRFWNEYGRGNKDSIELYIDEMRKFPNNTLFFLAAANEVFAGQIKRVFSDRIIELPDKDFQDAIDAVAELYLLGKTKILLATGGSTFSEVAWWLGGGTQQVKVIDGAKNWGVLCPVCGGTSKTIKHYTRQDCLAAYKHLYREVPEDLEIVDYEMKLCDICRLVFSNPMKPGSQSFYTWVTGHENYYPTVKSPRWEWEEVRTYVRENHVQTLLEIGCGTGEFLEYLREDTTIDAVGLDTTIASYEKCIERGFNAYNEPLERYVLDHEDRYDVVVAFHLLEHVENPLELVDDMMKLLKRGGKCMLSFPYSDARLDKCVTTANNMPPHHLTRWELPAIEALATAVNADIEIVAPQANSVEADIWNNLKHEYFPIYEAVPKNKVRLAALKHLKRTRDIVALQKSKANIKIADHIGGKSVERRPPWFVLVIFSKRSE